MLLASTNPLILQTLITPAMGDSSKPGTLSKLGKIFGKSQTNLSTIKQQQQQQQHLEKQKEANGNRLRQLTLLSPPPLPPSSSQVPKQAERPQTKLLLPSPVTSTRSNVPTEVLSSRPPTPIEEEEPKQLQQQALQNDEDYILSQIENDEVTPLRNIKQPQPLQPPPPPSSSSSAFAKTPPTPATPALPPPSSSPSPSSSSSSSPSSSSLPRVLNGNELSSTNSSPKLASARSASPINHNNGANNISNTLSATTSPTLMVSLDQRLKRQGSTNSNIPQPIAPLDTNKVPTITSSSSSSASGRTSPAVSRSSSRKVISTKPLQKTTPGLLAKHKNESMTSLVSGSGSSAQPQSLQTSLQNLPRFVMLENGNHEHHLRSAKRHEKLSNMLKDLLGAKKLRDGAKSAVPDLLHGAMQQSTSQLLQQQPQQQQQSQQGTSSPRPPTLFAGLVNQVKNHTSPYHHPGTADTVNKDAHATSTTTSTSATATGPDCRSFVEKYGRCQEVIGRGSFGVVRISHKKVDASNVNDSTATVSSSASSSGTQEKLYAVKEFKRKPNENEKKYNRRLTSEFCISSSLKHINIIDTLDLLKDAKGDYCEVMEFCSGGDLYTLIIALGKLEYAEADCFFKQLIRGVNYMHNMGVAHRDLKPENLLLTQTGVLKITDFGNSECFKMAWETDIQFSEGVCGSSPYIAPEEFNQESFDPRCVDIWSCGVIYMAMRTGRQLWKLADPSKDEFFEEYLVKRKDASGYEPIENLKRARCRNVIYSILDPKPERRITGKQILNSEWGREIKVCEAGEGHHLLENGSAGSS